MSFEVLKKRLVNFLNFFLKNIFVYVIETSKESMNYSFIVNPSTGERLNLFGREAVQLLKNYILTLRDLRAQMGGSESQDPTSTLAHEIQTLENDIVENCKLYNKFV